MSGARFFVRYGGAIVGGSLSRVIFPHEPGLTFLLYGGAGGLIVSAAATGCYWLARTTWQRVKP